MATTLATKFVKWDVPALEALKGSKAYILRTKLNGGGRLDRAERNWLTESVNHNTYLLLRSPAALGIARASSTLLSFARTFKDAVPLQGWRFDFSDILRTFLVNQYGQWTEYKATDKTALRNILFGNIIKIVEI